MKNDRTATPAPAALPDFLGIDLPDVMLWPLRMQETLWRETLLTMARMAELRAECLRDMAQVNLPMDAAAIQSVYVRKLLTTAEDEGSRIVSALQNQGTVARQAA